MWSNAYYLFFLILLCIGCSDYFQDSTISLKQKIADTPIASTGFDTLLCEINQLPPQLKIECILTVPYQNIKTEGSVKYEKLLREILPISSKKDQKIVLLRLISIYSKQDRALLLESSLRGINLIEQLENEHSLSSEEIWNLNKLKASFLNEQNRQQEFLSIWFKLLKEHRTAGKTPLILEDLNAIASYTIRLGDTEKSISFYKEAYLLAKGGKYKEAENISFMSIVWLLSKNKQFKEALAYFYEMGSSIPFNPSLYDTLIKCYIGTNKLDSARLILNKRISSIEKGKGVLYNQIAETYILEGKEDSSSVYLGKALKENQLNIQNSEEKENKISLPINFIHTYSLYAELLQKNSKTNQAEQAYSFIEPLMYTHVQSLNWKEKQINAITSYSTFCRTTKQYEKALTLLAHRDSLQQVYNVLKEKQEHTNIVNRFEIDDLTHRLELQDTELEYSKTLNQILVTAGIITFLLLTMLFLLFRSRKAQYLKLYQQHEQLRKLEDNQVIQPEKSDATKALYLNAENKVRSDKLFLKNDLSIEMLSEILNSNRTYLSSCINECTSKSYSIWINDFRIKYAIKLMHDDTTINIKNLAPQCGFSSNDTFYKNFKQRCGVTPGQYLNQIIIEQNKSGREG